MGGSSTVQLAGDADTFARRIGRASADVDLVLDDLWGKTTASAMVGVVTERARRSQ
jgi:hypothetical protein